MARPRALSLRSWSSDSAPPWPDPRRGVWAAGRYVPVLEDTDRRDLRARDAVLRAVPGNLLFAPRLVAALRVGRALAAHPGTVLVALAWAARLVRRTGVRGLIGAHPTTYVMHSFMDADDVGRAWDLLQRGVTATDPRLRATQERLRACAYGMAHPDRDEIVPACVQHSVPGGNAGRGHRVAVAHRAGVSRSVHP